MATIDYPVLIFNSGKEKASFTTPMNLTSDVDLTFRLTTTNSVGSSSKETTIRVLASDVEEPVTTPMNSSFELAVNNQPAHWTAELYGGSVVGGDNKIASGIDNVIAQDGTQSYKVSITDDTTVNTCQLSSELIACSNANIAIDVAYRSITDSGSIVSSVILKWYDANQANIIDPTCPNQFTFADGTKGEKYDLMSVTSNWAIEKFDFRYGLDASFYQVVLYCSAQGKGTVWFDNVVGEEGIIVIEPDTTIPVNGGFEQSITSNVPTRWEVSSFGMGTATAQLNTADVHSGVQSLEARNINPTTGEYFIVTDTFYAVKSGELPSFKVWAKRLTGSNANIRLYILRYTAAKELITDDNSLDQDYFTNVPTEWTEYTHSSNYNPSSMAYFKIGIQVVDYICRVLFDDVEITAGTDDLPSGGGSGTGATVFETQFNETTIANDMTNGWYAIPYATNAITIDQTQNAPNSTGNSVRIMYPAGFPNGDSPALLYRNFAELDEFYTEYWFRHSTNFEWASVVSKHIYLRAVADDIFVFDSVMMVNGSQKLDWGIQRADGYSARWVSNTGYNPTIIPDKWYKMKMYTKLNTNSQANGILKAWLDSNDGQGEMLVMDYSDKQYRYAAYPTVAVTQMELVPVWVSGANKARVDYVWFDGVKIWTP